METTGLDGLCPSFASRTPDFCSPSARQVRALFHYKKQQREANATLCYLVETTGLEPVTPCTSSKCSSQLSYASEVLLLYQFTDINSSLNLKYFKTIRLTYICCLSQEVKPLLFYLRFRVIGLYLLQLLMLHRMKYRLTAPLFYPKVLHNHRHPRR